MGIGCDMKTDISKTQAKDKVDAFFERKDFTSEDVKKIKRLAMRFKIRLGEKRRLFCKKCLSRLKGKTKITRGYKTVLCEMCDYKNKFKWNRKK